MKLIILEGGDRLGKSTLIEGLCQYFNYDNVTIRHFGKPPKGLTPEEFNKFQFNCFEKEQDLFFHISNKEFFGYNYYSEIMIWNRSHLGEYVYSQMFRGGDPTKLKYDLIKYENAFNYSKNIFLITLYADPQFFFNQEDGNSFSNKLEDKTKEMELFKEAHEFSTIKYKLLVKVNTGYNNAWGSGLIFKPKEDILNEVKNFIK